MLFWKAQIIKTSLLTLLYIFKNKKSSIFFNRVSGDSPLPLCAFRPSDKIYINLYSVTRVILQPLHSLSILTKLLNAFQIDAQTRLQSIMKINLYIFHLLSFRKKFHLNWPIWSQRGSSLATSKWQVSFPIWLIVRVKSWKSNLPRKPPTIVVFFRPP